MKVLLDIKDSKSEFVMELLHNLTYVKAKPITDTKAQLMSEIRDAVEEMKQVKAGKKKARKAQDFLNGL